VAATSGDASLSAAPGPTAFLFSEVSLGQDTIQGFDPSQDAIVLSHTQAANAATVLSDASSTGAGTLITLNPAQSILLQGVAPSSLHPTNVHLSLKGRLAPSIRAGLFPRPQSHYRHHAAV
jgi:hypothetical protein